MKLKKKTKRVILLLFIILLAIAGFFIYDKYFNKTVRKAITIDKIPAYGYNLKDNKPPKYIKMFRELKDILTEKPVDKEKYAKKITYVIHDAITDAVVKTVNYSIPDDLYADVAAEGDYIETA